MAKNNNNNGGNGLPINKISFFLVITVSIIFLVNLILVAIGGVELIKATTALMTIATSCCLILVCIPAWRYVARKEIVYKVLYAIVVTVALLGVILPPILRFT